MINFEVPSEHLLDKVQLAVNFWNFMAKISCQKPTDGNFKQQLFRIWQSFAQYREGEFKKAMKTGISKAQNIETLNSLNS